MKFLLILAAVLGLVWLLRSGRRGSKPSQAEASAPPPAGPQDMVRCARCGVHLPHDEAVVGHIGLYCSNEHRQQAEP